MDTLCASPQAWRPVCALATILLLAALGSQPVCAQDVTGALQGTIVSAESGPEQGVRVTLSGPNLQGVRETLTDRRGFYQFLAVPPGVYELNVARMGLRAMTVQRLVVELGRTTAVPTLTLALQPIMMEPVVTVVPRITIDPVGTAGGGTLDERDYALLPVDRDYKSILTVLPGANQSYRGDPVNVGGSTGLENQYYIDGVNVTDTKTAARATSLPYNFVRAVEVKTGGYEAQYGRALGAVVNAITYSGTNEFEAQVFGFTQPGSLTLAPREATTLREEGAIIYDGGARVSGPLVRDRLWYSAAVNPRVDTVDKEILGHGLFADRTEAVRFASKLTWQASPATSLELSMFGDPTTRDEVITPWPGLTTILNSDVLLHRVESGGLVGSLRGTIAPSRSLLLQAAVARQWHRYSQRPRTLRGREELPYLDWVEGAVGGGRGGFLDEDRDRSSLAVQATLFVPGHTFVAGIDYEDALNAVSFEGANIQRIDTDLYLRDDQSVHGTVHNRSPAVYVQDSWRITDRLTVNPGLRWSGQYLIGASGRTAQNFADEWQPRLGFSCRIGAAGAQRLYGSYGRFYQSVPTSMAISWYVDYPFVYSSYSVDPRQPGAEPDAVYDYTTYEADFARQIPGLQAENFHEFTLGYERLVGAGTRLGVRATRRDLGSSFQWGINDEGDWIIGTPGEGAFDFLPPPRREYTAVEVAAEGSWRRWQYRASYVLSRTWGNYPGLFDSEPGYESPGGARSFQTPNQAENSTGQLPNDRPHAFKLSGAWTSRFGLQAGAFVTAASGTPVNDFAAGPFGATNPTFLVARGSAGRTPALWDVNLRLAYELPGVRAARPRMLLDLLHVGHPRRAVRWDELHYLTLDENGDPATPNPDYRQPMAYQPPMAVRVGVEASF